MDSSEKNEEQSLDREIMSEKVIHNKVSSVTTGFLLNVIFLPVTSIVVLLSLPEFYFIFYLNISVLKIRLPWPEHSSLHVRRTV